MLDTFALSVRLRATYCIQDSIPKKITILLTVALILTNIKTQKLVQLADFDSVVQTTDENVDLFVKPDFWTDISFEELLQSGCQAVRKLYKPNLTHEKGYSIAYRKGQNQFH